MGIGNGHPGHHIINHTVCAYDSHKQGNGEQSIEIAIRLAETSCLVKPIGSGVVQLGDLGFGARPSSLALSHKGNGASESSATRLADLAYGFGRGGEGLLTS